MLQLHPSLNLIDAPTFHLRLQMPKSLVPVHGLCVLKSFQKSWHLPAADAGGRPFGSLLHDGAQSACKPFAFLGAASGAWNRGEAGGKGGGGGNAADKEENRGGRL